MHKKWMRYCVFISCLLLNGCVVVHTPPNQPPHPNNHYAHCYWNQNGVWVCDNYNYH